MSDKQDNEVLDALEDMARQHCFTYGQDHGEPNITESQGLSANADALEILADHGRFRVERSFGRMVIGYWPEHVPKSNMSDAKQYRKKPVVIKAIEYTGDNAQQVLDFIGGGALIGDDEIVIETLEGNMSATPGCFVIRGVAGEYYPCAGDIFRQTYEAVE